MINLLKNKKVEDNNIAIDADEIKSEPKEKPQELSQEQIVKERIGRYKDPEGLTVSKLDWGLWWVKNRTKIIKAGVIFLIIVSVITWSIFIFTFGYYVFFGMKEDEKVLQGITSGPSVNHEAVVAMSAQDLRSQNVKTFKVLDGRYDLSALVTNPNNRFYAEFDYYFIGNGQETEKKHGFILPGDSKYFFKLGQDFSSAPNDVEFRMVDVRWMKIDSKKFPDWENFKNERLNIKTDGMQFSASKSTVLTEKLDLNELKFTAHNYTIFNYWQVNLKIMLYSRGEIAGINEYTVENFKTDEARDITMTWPGRFSRIDDIVIIPELDVTKSNIYADYKGGTGSIK